MSAHEHVTLITGFPANELATRVLDRLMKLKPDERFVCIVPARLHDQARE